MEPLTMEDYWRMWDKKMEEIDNNDPWLVYVAEKSKTSCAPGGAQLVFKVQIRFVPLGKNYFFLGAALGAALASTEGSSTPFRLTS